MAGFKWNGIHTASLGVRAEVRRLPVIPEPKLVLEEIPGRNGFLDYSKYNVAREVSYHPIDWEYRCVFEHLTQKDFKRRIDIVKQLFPSYSGILEPDDYPGMKWSGVITRTIEVTLSGTISEFTVIFRTQPFPEEE
jgi:phage-related protein